MAKTATAVKEAEATKTVELSRDLKAERAQLFQGLLDSILQHQELAIEQNDEKIAEYLKGAVEKRDQLVEFLQDIKAQADAIRERAKQLTEFARRLEAGLYEPCRESIRLQLENWGVKRVDGKVHRIYLRDGKDSIEITDQTLLPAEFVDWEPKPNKQAISEALHDGREVPGAQLIPAKKSLVIS